MNVRDRMKVLITVILLPLLGLLIIDGARSDSGAQVGISLAIVGLLGTFWGAPGKGGDSP